MHWIDSKVYCFTPNYYGIKVIWDRKKASEKIMEVKILFRIDIVYGIVMDVDKMIWS